MSLIARKVLILALPVATFYACSFPDHTFNDAEFYGQSAAGTGDELGGSGGSTGGTTIAHGGTGGTAGKGGGTSGGGTSATAGSAGSKAGSAGSAGTTGGSGGQGGSTSGTGGSAGSKAGSSGMGVGGNTGPGGQGIGGNTGGATSAGGSGAGGMAQGNCAHDVCTVGDPLVSGCNSCVTQVCGALGSCCDDTIGSWNSQCVDEANSLCGSNCGTGGSAGTTGTGGGGAGGSIAAGADCTTTGLCGTGQACIAPDPTTKTVACAAASPGGTIALGDPCTVNSKCESFDCDGFSKVCSAFCATADQCGADGVCVSAYVPSADDPQWNQSQCRKPCAKDSDCPANAGGEQTCFLELDTIDNAPVFACDFIGAPIGSQGVMGFGATISDPTMGGTDACYNGFYTHIMTGTTPAPGFYCTKSCETTGSPSADCAAPFPNCLAQPFQNPTGSGETFVKICVN